MNDPKLQTNLDKIYRRADEIRQRRTKIRQLCADLPPLVCPHHPTVDLPIDYDATLAASWLRDSFDLGLILCFYPCPACDSVYGACEQCQAEVAQPPAK